MPCCFQRPPDLGAGGRGPRGGTAHRPAGAMAGAAEAERQRLVGPGQDPGRGPHAPGDEDRLTDGPVRRRRLRVRRAEGAGGALPVHAQLHAAVPLQLGHVVGHVVTDPELGRGTEHGIEDVADRRGDRPGGWRRRSSPRRTSRAEVAPAFGRREGRTGELPVRELDVPARQQAKHAGGRSRCTPGGPARAIRCG